MNRPAQEAEAGDAQIHRGTGGIPAAFHSCGTRAAEPRLDARHGMEDHLDYGSPLPLAILEVVEHFDRPRHDFRWAAGRQEVLVHLGHAAAAGSGKREQAQKRPEREYQAVAHDPLGRGQPTIANDNRCEGDAEEREADGQHPSPQPFPGLHCHLSPPYRHGEGLGIENLTPPHRQQLQSRTYHTDDRSGETLVV